MVTWAPAAADVGDNEVMDGPAVEALATPGDNIGPPTPTAPTRTTTAVSNARPALSPITDLPASSQLAICSWWAHNCRYTMICQQRFGCGPGRRDW